MNTDVEAVVKVTYQGTLRRFNLLVKKDGSFDLDMTGLKTKICNLFNLAPDADLNITYKDEDGDQVKLVDDLDLCDAIKQRIDPLRILVCVKTEHCRLKTDACTQKPKQLVPAPPKVSILSSSDDVVSKGDKSLIKLVDDLASKIASSVPVKYKDLMFGTVADSSDDLVEFAKSVSKLGMFDQVSVVEDQISKEKEKEKEKDGLNKSKESRSTPEAEDNGGNMTRSVSTSDDKNNGKMSTKKFESSDDKSKVPKPGRMRDSSSSRTRYGGYGPSYSPTCFPYNPTNPSYNPC